MLQDKYGRTIDYLRIAVTDRCNLRCFYCMPEEGIDFKKKDQLMRYEELLRVCNILGKNGVHKIRITGGEPFLRKDIMHFITDLSKIPEIKKIAITTNGTLTLRHLDSLLSLGIYKYNLSIDSLDKQRFFDITRRDSFDDVWDCFLKMSNNPNIDLKLNAVVIDGKNIEDIIPMVGLSKEKKVAIRFIEEMPFNGEGRHYQKLEWDHKKILQHITDHFGKIDKLPDPKNSTSFNYQVKGFVGSFGIIPAYTRSFCGTCNRLRLTPEGTIKTCLYDEGVFNLRDLMRQGASDAHVLDAIREAISHKAKDGFAAEKRRKFNPNVSESMSSIGG